MPRITCPYCKNSVTVAEVARGTLVACTQCQRRLRVPAARWSAKAPPPDAITVRGGITSAPPQEHRFSADAPVHAEDSWEELPPQDDAKPAAGLLATGAVGCSGVLVFIGLFFLILSGEWLKLFGDSGPTFLYEYGIPPAAATGGLALVLLVGLGMFLAWLIKSLVIAAMPDEVDFRCTSPAAFPQHDAQRLADYTAAFEALGFRHVTDYTALLHLNNGVTGFARLFFHDEHRCFAEVNQAFRNGAPLLMRCVVQSFLEHGWSVAVTDRQTNKETYLIRRPRGPWRSLPGRDPAALLEALLKFRQRVAGGLGLEVCRDGSAEGYFRREAENNRQRKDAVRRRNAVAMCMELWLFDKNPKSEWLGDYPRAARGKG
jgi:hypothetical protein